MIRRVINGRGTGKTKELMQYAKDNNATFVCSNPKAMEEKSHAYEIFGINFISYQDFFNRRGTVGKYVIDELEDYANWTYGADGRIVGYSLTDED